MSKGGKRSSNMLERVAGRYAQRMIQVLQLEGCDIESCRLLFTLWLLCIKDVLRLELPDYQAEVGRMIASMRGVSWQDIVTILKDLDEFLLVGNSDSIGTYQYFKRTVAIKCQSSGGVSVHMPSLLLKLMYLGVKDHDTECFRRAHQILTFPTRPDILTRDARKVLEKKLEEKFLATESRIASLEFPPDHTGFFQRYLSEYDPYESFVPRLSNGSALTVLGSSRFWYDKWMSLSTCDSNFDYLEYQIGYRITRDSDRIPDIDASRFFAVPKDSARLRGISIEPALRAYVQQGFMISLRRYIRNHPYLSRRIDFMHPEYSSKLAQEGSISGRFSTIDLSDASDSVLWEVVKAFADDTPLLEALTICRAPDINLMDGSRLRLEKFGGMGNALTFPLECLIFSCIVEQGIRDAGGSVRKSRYRVYGDDIVVESEYFDSVCKRLELYGFKINNLKSFSPRINSFREACGGEYYEGADVKPIRLPRGPLPTFDSIQDHRNAEAVACFIDIANSCYQGLPSVRLFIIHELFRVLPANLWPVFTLDGSTGLRSDTPTNFHLKKLAVSENSVLASWHYDYVLVHGALAPRKEHIEVPEYAQYEYRLNQLMLRQSEIEQLGLPPIDLKVDLSARQTGLRWKSIKTPDYYSAFGP